MSAVQVRYTKMIRKINKQLSEIRECYKRIEAAELTPQPLQFRVTEELLPPFQMFELWAA